MNQNLPANLDHFQLSMEYREEGVNGSLWIVGGIVEEAETVIVEETEASNFEQVPAEDAISKDVENNVRCVNIDEIVVCER